MSDETHQAIQEAIRAHVQDETGESLILTDWLAVAAGVGQEAEVTNYTYIASNSPAHVHTGLAEALKVRHSWPRRDWGDDDE